MVLISTSEMVDIPFVEGRFGLKAAEGQRLCRSTQHTTFRPHNEHIHDVSYVRLQMLCWTRRHDGHVLRRVLQARDYPACSFSRAAPNCNVKVGPV
jgi:hypothetical protein